MMTDGDMTTFYSTDGEQTWHTSREAALTANRIDPNEEAAHIIAHAHRACPGDPDVFELELARGVKRFENEPDLQDLIMVAINTRLAGAAGLI